MHFDTIEVAANRAAQGRGRGLAFWLVGEEYVVDSAQILAMRRRCPDLAVLAFTRRSCRTALLDLIGRQPAGVGLHYRPATELVDIFVAIETVARGGFWLDPRLARQAIAAEAEELNPYGLTGVQRQVADGMAGALRNSTIAAQQHMSEKSVEKHVTAIYTKLGLTVGGSSLHRRVQAALMLGRVNNGAGRVVTTRPGAGRSTAAAA